MLKILERGEIEVAAESLLEGAWSNTRDGCEIEEPELLVGMQLNHQ